MMFDFKDKVVAVTGASRGIGLRIAERFYEAGAMLSICCPDRADILRAAAAISGPDTARILAEAADVSKVRDIRVFLHKTSVRFGTIDILVNNAGVQFPHPSSSVTERHWDETLDTNLKGCFFASQSAADVMIKNKGGCIVNIGSVNGLTVFPGQAAYAASKAGMSHLTKILAREWGKSGIRVNCVAPGSIPTPINAASYQNNPASLRDLEEKLPLGRRGTTDDVADAVLFLASEYAAYITGQTLFVDGGRTLVNG